VTSPVVTVPEAVAGSWHDQAPAIASAALEQLRLAEDDIDAGRVASKALAACSAIDRDLDLRAVAGRVAYLIGGVAIVSYAAGDAPADILEAAVQLTVELYRRKDAQFGVLNAWSPSGEPLRISRDQLAGIDSLLAPWREGWGIG
jgi:hypothetical protein